MLRRSVDDLLDRWGEVMADIRHNLRIKYGLRNDPAQDLVRRWVQTTESLIRAGEARERAGRVAASEIFPDFNTMVYASEADDIESLLDAAKDR